MRDQLGRIGLAATLTIIGVALPAAAADPADPQGDQVVTTPAPTPTPSQVPLPASEPEQLPQVAPEAQASIVPAPGRIAYQGISFDAPEDWPIIDLEADPTACVRYDVHAVYLGTPGSVSYTHLTLPTNREV